MADALGTEWRVLSNAAKVFAQDETAAKKLATAYDRLADQIDTTNEAGRKEAEQAKKVSAASVKTATQLGKEARAMALATKLVRENGLSKQAALRTTRLLERQGAALTAQVLREAKAYDRAEKELKELTRAKRGGGGVTKAFGSSLRGVAGELLAMVGAVTLARAALRVVFAQLRGGFVDFTTLEDAVVSLRKVTDELSAASLGGLVAGLEDLSTGPVPILTADLIELGATAAQMGIQSAAGIKLAAETGAQLAEATDLSGTSAIKSLSRLLAIQGESVDALDNLGSSFVELGNTSRATEAEIEPVANEITRATANFKLGSATVLGFSAALAEMGAKAEGSGSALAELLNKLLKAAETGKGLDELAQVAGVTTDELRTMVRDDVGGAAVQFLEGLQRFGEKGAIALDKVGLGSKRTAKALLPLAANVDRLRDRIEVSNEAFEENTALQEEAEAAFNKLSADVQRAENAFTLLRSELFSGMAPALSTILQSTADLLVDWRELLKALKATPAVSGTATVALVLLSDSVQRTVDGLTKIPKLLSAIAGVSLGPTIKALDAISKTPIFLGGAIVSGPALKTADALREVQDALLGLASAGGEGSDVADDLAEKLKKIPPPDTAPGVDDLGTAIRDVRTEIEDQIRAQAELIGIMARTKASSEDVEAAQGLMARGFKGSFDEALTLTQQLGKLRDVAEVLAGVGQLDLLPPDLGGFPSLPDGAPLEREQLGSFAPGFTDKLSEGMAAAGEEFGFIMESIGVDFGLALLAGGEELSSFMQDALPSVLGSLGQTAGSAFGPLGGIAGGIVGELLGSVLGGLFKRGADQASAVLEVVGGQLTAFAEKVEGDLGPALESMASDVIQSVNLILAEFGGELAAGRFGFLIREGEVVRVFYEGLTAEFEDEAAAASFLVAKILSASMIEGLGASVEEALRGGDFQSVDELLSSLRFAENVDALLRTPLEQFFASIGAESRVFLQTAAELGINLDRATAAMATQAQAALDQARDNILSAAGVDGAIAQFRSLQDEISKVTPQAIARLEAELEQAARQALDAAAAQAAMGESFDGTAASIDAFIRTQGLAGEEAENLRDRFEELVDSGASAEEIVAELSVSLRGMSTGEIQQAMTVFRQQFIGGLLSSLADLADRAGNAALAAKLRAKAEEIQFRMQLLSIRLTLRQAEAEGLLNEARGAQIRGFIREIQQSLNELLRAGGFGAAPAAAGGRGGGAGRVDESARAAAAEAERRLQATMEFDEAFRSLVDSMSGASDRALSFRDALDQLNTQAVEAEESTFRQLRATRMLARAYLEEIAAPFEQAARGAREGNLQGRVREAGARAVAALAEAAEAEAANPEAFARAAQAIARGLDAELSQFGKDILGSVGNEFVRLRREGAQLARDLRFAAAHLDELGLSAEQLARTVRGGVMPELLALAIQEAERVGDLQRAASLRQRQADIERRLIELQLRMWEAQLAAVGALDEATRALIDGIIRDLGRESAASGEGAGGGGGTTEDRGDRPGASDRDPRRGGRDEGAHDFLGNPIDDSTAADNRGTLADLIEDLLGETRSPMEKLEAEFEALIEQIATLAGTDEERALAVQLAEEKLARQREELLERQAELLRRQTQDVRDLIEELTTGELSGLSEEDRLAALVAEAQDLSARAAGGEEGASEELAATVRAALDLIDSISGTGEDLEIAARRADLLALLQASLGQANAPLHQANAALPTGSTSAAQFSPGAGQAAAAGAQVAALSGDVSTLVAAVDRVSTTVDRTVGAVFRANSGFHAAALPHLANLDSLGATAPEGGGPGRDV